MKARLLIATLLAILVLRVASAQSYQIRVNYTTNLRAAYSLEAARVETVPAGTILQVAGRHNRWLRISRNNSEVWMASWVAHTRVEDQQTAPSDIDNCCQVNQHCATDEEWRRGWAAFKHYQCRTDLPIAIEGGEGFRSQILESLLLLRRRSPKWYGYTISGLDKVVQTGSYEDTYVNFHTKVFYLHYDDSWNSGVTSQEHFAYTASVLVHEACHVHRHEAGFAYHGWQAREEGACTQVQLEAYEAIDPVAPLSPWLRELLANIENPEYQWWH